MNTANQPLFTCVRCGQCCRWHGYVQISEEEIEHIAEFTGMDIAEFYEEMIMPGDGEGVSLSEKEDGSCPFYVDSPPGCRIYECRPAQCRTYPIKWNNPEKPCPGIRRQNIEHPTLNFEYSKLKFRIFKERWHLAGKE